MTTITITGKQPGKTDVTISSTVNPAVKTVVPVTVLSRNLLSYGPASGSGLTATVNSDGSLHVTGTATGEATDWTAWASSITLHPGDYYLVPNITGTGINVAMLDPAGDASNQQTGAFTVASTETWAARIFTTAATGPVNATVTPRLYKID